MAVSEIEEQIAASLQAKGLSISVAEACTAGLVAYRLTSIPGSSRYFIGGVLAYANEVKQQLLKVPDELLRTQGSVCEATALAMARGVRQLLGTDLGVSTTGITGPGGGTPERPPGLFFVAVAGPGPRERCERHLFQGDRIENKRLAAEAALGLVKRSLLE
ncbi:MAG: CinA family protein [Dehalococcoidia bacterium]